MNFYKKKYSYLLLVFVFLFALVGCDGLKKYTLTIDIVPAGSGSVTPASGTVYNEETLVTLIPEANESWKFEKWGGEDGQEVVENNDGEWTILVDSDKNIAAEFVQLSSDATLADLVLVTCKDEEIEIDPPFDPEITEYETSQQVSVGSQVGFIPTPSDAKAVITIEDIVVEPGVISEKFDISTGDNWFTITVTAEDGITTKDYDINVQKSLFGTP